MGGMLPAVVIDHARYLCLRRRLLHAAEGMVFERMVWVDICRLTADSQMDLALGVLVLRGYRLVPSRTWAS